MRKEQEKEGDEKYILQPFISFLKRSQYNVIRTCVHAHWCLHFVSLPLFPLTLFSGFPLPPTPHHLLPVVKYSCRLMPLSSPETFHNALVFPAGVKTAPIITLNIHVFVKTRS